MHPLDRNNTSLTGTDVHTLIVCTVLTGIRAMATLENMCPPTWKTAIGAVFWTMARVGGLSLLIRMIGLMNSKQYPATKPNCTNVKVTGYRNWVRIALPVLDDIADDMYHSEHKRTNRTVEADIGRASVELLETALRLILGTSRDALCLPSGSRPNWPDHPVNQPERLLCPPRFSDDQLAAFSPNGHPFPFPTGVSYILRLVKIYILRPVAPWVHEERRLSLERGPRFHVRDSAVVETVNTLRSEAEKQWTWCGCTNGPVERPSQPRNSLPLHYQLILYFSWSISWLVSSHMYNFFKFLKGLSFVQSIDNQFLMLIQSAVYATSLKPNILWGCCFTCGIAHLLNATCWRDRLPRRWWLVKGSRNAYSNTPSYGSPTTWQSGPYRPVCDWQLISTICQKNTTNGSTSQKAMLALSIPKTEK